MQKIKYFSTKEKSSLVRRSILAESQSIMLSGGEKTNLKKKTFFHCYDVFKKSKLWTRRDLWFPEVRGEGRCDIGT